MDAGMTTVEHTPDNLLGGSAPAPVTETVTILSGEGALSRGRLLGKIDRAAGAPDGTGNTGDGTMTAVSLGIAARLGTYTVECIAAAANGGTFKVVDPDGYAIDAQAEVGTSFASDHLNFTLNDGATDFIVGDKFTVVVGAGSGKYRAYNAANTDGSQHPVAILGADVDATAADKPASVYLMGCFNGASVTGYAAGLKPALRQLGIFIKSIS